MNAEYVYPARLQAVLREQYGYSNVEVVNAGVLGYTTWETLVNLEFRALELQPDMIILYDGLNDGLSRNTSQDCFAGMNPIRGLHPSRKIWNLSVQETSPSALYRFVALNLGWIRNPFDLENNFTALELCNSADSKTEAERLAENPPDYFERNLHSIIAVARANNIRVVLSTNFYDPQNRMPDWWKQAMNDSNTVIRQTAAQLDVPLCDLMQDLTGDKRLWTEDGFHQSQKGMQAQADRYAAFLIDQNLLPKQEKKT
jgi:lysophospholipase L1-like esterase